MEVVYFFAGCLVFLGIGAIVIHVTVEEKKKKFQDECLNGLKNIYGEGDFEELFDRAIFEALAVRPVQSLTELVAYLGRQLSTDTINKWYVLERVRKMCDKGQIAVQSYESAPFPTYSAIIQEVSTNL